MFKIIKRKTLIEVSGDLLFIRRLIFFGQNSPTETISKLDCVLIRGKLEGVLSKLNQGI